MKDERATYVLAGEVDDVRWIAETDGVWLIATPDAETLPTNDKNPMPVLLVGIKQEALGSITRVELAKFATDCAPACLECGETGKVVCAKCAGDGATNEVCLNCGNEHACAQGCGDCNGVGKVDCGCAYDGAAFCVGNRSAMFDPRMLPRLAARVPVGAERVEVCLAPFAESTDMLILRVGAGWIGVLAPMREGAVRHRLVVTPKVAI